MQMKAFITTCLGFGSLALAAVPGFDISHYQSSVDFAAAYNSGARFVIIKATEGTSYKDPKFSAHYTGATNAGLIRGGYHFARPGSSSGAAQASYFLANGGGWSGDGLTLPGMLDLEGDCAGLSASAMVAWIRDFSNTYRAKTGRYPLLYTNPSWWASCTGDSSAFVDTHPLVLARYSSSAGTPPGGWPYYTIWQFNDAYKYGGDSDTFNGDLTQLKKLAQG
ncbi:glycoside hydrolase family 25 protein [Daldinia caldariorum]|uniref:glycoside hydrolase family 25 protein n=1 Tax=Daldinia caldariorum TaxID=326644 RepID=UPI0020073545|nr:glycoside hydrolase family 25 protein [Daldinia caldariorum]KAI1462972.1 glycoside hydrolase family 25 protein [Daldinia caldariorum]